MAKRTKKSGTRRARVERDVYQEVTDKIVAALEAGTAPWTKPWVTLGEHRNASSGRPYSGINILLLWITAEVAGYSRPLWLTFNQAKDLGGHVRKGEKGTQICFWKKVARSEMVEGVEKDRSFMMVRTYTVFNVDQCEDLPEEKIARRLPALQGFAGDAACDALIEATGATIAHGGDRAYYHPSSDSIRLPLREQFAGAHNYYATTFHELTHWTGHKSRLDRDLKGRFGDESYAAEELVAELGAAFLCAKMGVAGECRHPAYIESWLKVLKGDKKAIFTAASKARQAAAFLSENGAEDHGEVEAEEAA